MARRANFTVQLSKPHDVVVQVSYATVSDLGQAGVDYTHVSGVLTFQPGETTKKISVPIRATDPVGNRAFRLQLSKPVNARLVDPYGMAIIPSAT